MPKKRELPRKRKKNLKQRRQSEILTKNLRAGLADKPNPPGAVFWYRFSQICFQMVLLVDLNIKFDQFRTETDSSGYELPSTGGTGTLPYTAVGGTMMLSALAYSIIHRKRRREGRVDD